jgi:hypothetical protein
MDNVNSVFQKISEKLYSQAQDMTENMADNMNTQDAEVNDVDFEEVK